jgi:biopolymer transport protein ExbD
VLSHHQVRAKTRLAVRRREEQIEQDEIESGELNLIPYLDIVTNLMLFLLASVTANIIFGQINTQLPDQGAPPAAQANDPGKKPDEQPLGMAVAVTKDEILLFSFSGLEGTIKEPKLRVPRTGRPGDACDAAYLCETNTCVNQVCKANPDFDVTPVFDYRMLNKALIEIADRRFHGQLRKPETYQAILMADPAVPYGTLISVISAMRCPMPAFGQASQTCYIPTADEALRNNKNPVDDVARLYDTTRTPYDAKKLALFPDVVFSGGFR